MSTLMCGSSSCTIAAIACPGTVVTLISHSVRKAGCAPNLSALHMPVLKVKGPCGHTVNALSMYQLHPSH